MMKKRILTATAVFAAAALALGGCASGGDGGNNAGGNNDDWACLDSGSTSGAGALSEGANVKTVANVQKTRQSGSVKAANGNKDITIGVFSGWPEGIAVSYLWQNVLESKGYDVTLGTPGEAGPVFTGAAKGDYDLLFDAWLPNTHKKYWDKYGDKLEDLGTWYDDAPLTVAVNKDAPIESLDQLAACADHFDNKIIGIEPGAGLTGVMKDSVIPKYGLEKMDFETSSTAAMLAALKGAIKKDQNVVVTLWKPQWAYDAFPIKDLKDPKNALGDPDGIHVVGDKGFSDDFPEVAGWLGDFKFPDDKLANLEKKMFQPDESGNTPDPNQYPEIVDKWISDNQDFVDGLTS